MNKSELMSVLEHFQIEIPQESVDQLDEFARCLWEWNTKLNLTRHTDYETFVVRDVVDTLELSKLIHRDESVLDIGTGGGIPGMTLAILRPDLTVSLTDSVGKKAKVLESMVRQLGLEIDVYNQRAEKLLEDFSFDVCTARAVGPLWKICRWLENCWLEAGRLLATKGPRWTEERLEAKEKGLLKKVNLRCAAEYETPVINAQNVILKLWAKGAPEK